MEVYISTQVTTLKLLQLVWLLDTQESVLLCFPGLKLLQLSQAIQAGSHSKCVEDNYEKLPKHFIMH